MMTKILLTAALVLNPLAGSAREPTWGNCPASPPFPAPGKDVDCTTIQVPVDWNNPDGEKIPLFVSRHKARKDRLGVLVTNPGGPGNPGSVPVTMARDEFPDELLDRFDIIGFDPRGIGASNPIRCDDKLLKPITPPRTKAAYDKLVESNRRLGESCRKRTGALFDHLDTASVARDVDAIRRALGEEKISFLGQSYGSLIGQQYADLFGGHVRALVLDSVVDHGVKDAGAYLREGAIESQRAFDKHVKQPVDALFGRADKGILRYKGKKVTADQLTELLNGYLAVGGTPELGSSLKALSTGKGEVRWLMSGPEIMFRATWCQDFNARFTGYADYRRAMAAARRAAPDIRGNTQAITFVLGCQGWPAKTVNPPRAHRFKVPTLIANHRIDLATPYAAAQRVHRRLPGSKLATLNGTGHITYARLGLTSEKKRMQRVITTFLSH
ncbi:alpha/beta fold hydrolase [Streptosporangium canum]|uniref:alpha/beta fold hydrolase n=1 Tax=Streptosporangium canum TaxID=324952 RepID=UPI00342FBFAD